MKITILEFIYSKIDNMNFSQNLLFKKKETNIFRFQNIYISINLISLMTQSHVKLQSATGKSGIVMPPSNKRYSQESNLARCLAQSWISYKYFQVLKGPNCNKIKQDYL